jgi:hypothetical protein
VQEVLAQLPWYHQLALLDKLLESLPEPLQTSLPSIEEIERRLEGK